MGTTRRRGARTAIWAVRLMLAGTVIAPAVEMPNLSGDWQLNKDASDDPEKVMKDARSSGGGYSGGGMGRGGGRHGGGGGGGSWGRGGRSDSDDSGSGGGTGGWFTALETLQIKHA